MSVFPRFLTQSDIAAIAKSSAVLTDWHPRGTVLHLAAMLVARNRGIPAEQLIDVAMQNRYDFRRAASSLQLSRGKPMAPAREAVPREGYRRYETLLCWPLLPRGNRWRTEIEPISLLEDENTDYFVDGNFLRFFSQIHPERCFHSFPDSSRTVERVRPSILDSRGGRVKLAGRGLSGVSSVWLVGDAVGARALRVEREKEGVLEVRIPAVEPGLYHVVVEGVSWGWGILVREATEESDDAFEESPAWRRRGFVSLCEMFDEGDVEGEEGEGDGDGEMKGDGDKMGDGEMKGDGNKEKDMKGEKDKKGDGNKDKDKKDKKDKKDDKDNHREMEGDKDMDTGDKDKKGDGDKKDENAMDPITMHNNTTQTDIIDITNDTYTPNITNDTYTPNITNDTNTPDIDTLVDFYHTQAAIAPLAQPPPQRFLSFKDDQFHQGRFAHPALVPEWRHMHRAITRQNYRVHLPATFSWEPPSLMMLEDQIMWRNGRRIHMERIQDAMRHLPGYEILFDRMTSGDDLLDRVQLLQRLAYMDFYHGAKSRRG